MVCRPVGSSFRVVQPQPKAVYKGRSADLLAQSAEKYFFTFIFQCLDWLSQHLCTLHCTANWNTQRVRAQQEGHQCPQANKMKSSVIWYLMYAAVLAEIHVDDQLIHSYALSLCNFFFVYGNNCITLFFQRKIIMAKTGLTKTGPAGPLATAMMCILNWNSILKPVLCTSHPPLLSSGVAA